ncbi:MAG: dephospho-CoA kinase [Pseudomonadota bacterium]
MRILGLTGGIAMGKSTAAKVIRGLGVPVHDADAAVHRLYGKGGSAVAPIAARFPEALHEEAIDRAALSRAIVKEPARLAELEAVLHPLVRAATQAWLRRQARQRHRLVVLDIPLLYETGGERLCDAVLVVSAPAFLQRQRALARPGMSPAKLEAILNRQVGDAERQRRCDYLVPTGLGRGFAFRRLRAALTAERQAGPGYWPSRRRRRR